MLEELHTCIPLLVSRSGCDQELCVWNGHIRVWMLEHFREMLCTCMHTPCRLFNQHMFEKTGVMCKLSSCSDGALEALKRPFHSSICTDGALKITQESLLTPSYALYERSMLLTLLIIQNNVSLRRRHL